jgi:hypothetical protein
MGSPDYTSRIAGITDVHHYISPPSIVLKEVKRSVVIFQLPGEPC